MKFLLLLLIPSWAFSYVYFIPPSQWEMADPKDLAKHVEISFIGKPDLRSRFCPSINLATEKIAVSQEKYVQAVKKLHQHKQKEEWRDLGDFKTRAGTAHLTCIDTQADQNELKLLQLILVRDQTAYILTAGVLKRDFLALLPAINESFRSLTYTDDLLSAIEDAAHREKMRKSCETFATAWKKSQDSLRSLKGFEKQLSSECPDLGAHWQFLLMRQLTKS